MRLSQNAERTVQQISKSSPLFLNNNNKETAFSAHFRELNEANNSRPIIPFKTVFQAYNRKESLIDAIVNSHDIGKIANIHDRIEYQQGRELCAGFSQKIKTNILDINNFFNEKIDGKVKKVNNALDYDSFALVLSCLSRNGQAEICPESQIVYRPLITQQNGQGAIQRSKDNLVESKVELLLHELSSQKQRREEIQSYQEGIEIKLNELFDYVIRDDQFMGMSLQGKAQAILPCLAHFRGEVIDGWPKLQLIQVFFQELKELQQHRLKLLKIRKSRDDESQEIKSEKDKSAKSMASSAKKPNYSEPSWGKKQSQTQKWIGSLQ